MLTITYGRSNKSKLLSAIRQAIWIIGIQNVMNLFGSIICVHLGFPLLTLLVEYIISLVF